MTTKFFVLIGYLHLFLVNLISGISFIQYEVLLKKSIVFYNCDGSVGFILYTGMIVSDSQVTAAHVKVCSVRVGLECPSHVSQPWRF